MVKNLIPNKKQWKSWSLPSKYTAFGFLFGLISTLYILYQSILFDGKKDMVSEIIIQAKNAYREVEEENEVKNAFVERYLKKRVALIQNSKFMHHKGQAIARVYYDSYWEALTSTFSAVVEVRRIHNLNKKYSHNEGWAIAKLLNNHDLTGDSFYLGSSKYLNIANLLVGEIYEVRIVDYNYESDEPPSLPYRFIMTESN